jgi:integrase
VGENRINVWVQRFPDRPTLQLQWIDPETGRRKTKSAETDDPEKAERKRSDLEYELNHGTYQEASKLDWDRFRELFETEYLPGLRERTQEKYRTVLDVFEQIINPTKLRGITERTISLLVKGMRERTQPRNGKVGLAPMTMKNYLIALKSALGWAVDQKLLPALPKFPTIKVPKKKPQPIPVEAFEKLLQKAPDDLWRAYLLCGWWAGLRLSEASQLRWEPSEEWPWVDFEGNRIVLPAVFAKSAEDQSVPMHPVLRQALEALPRTDPKVFPFRSRKGGKPMTRAGISSRVRLIARQAGVRLSMHKLRKGFGCRVAKKLGKGNAPVLHSLMRHSSMQITMDYYASVDDALQDAIREL